MCLYLFPGSGLKDNRNPPDGCARGKGAEINPSHRERSPEVVVVLVINLRRARLYMCRHRFTWHSYLPNGIRRAHLYCSARAGMTMNIEMAGREEILVELQSKATINIPAMHAYEIPAPATIHRQDHASQT